MPRVDLRHLAWLAMLEVDEAEREELERRLEAAARIVDKLLEARVEGYEPLYHPVEEEGLLRSDEVSEPRFDKSTALANAGATEGGYVVAPRTVSE